jgi:hypothetical protein
MAAVALMAWIYVVWGDDHSDIGVYHRYALGMFGPGAARRLPAEYPILALAPFSITLAPAGDYGVAFVTGMALPLIATFAVVWRAAPASTAAAFTVCLLLAGPWTLFGRYDLVPSLLVLGAVAAAGRGRWRIAYPLLAAGVLLKLYPLFLLPVFAIAQRRQGARSGEAASGPAIFVAVVAAGLAISALLDPLGWLNPVRYALGRPTEVESMPATVLWILSGFRTPGTLQHSFNSANLVSAESPLVNTFFLLALVAGLCAVYVWLASGRLSLRRACIAALLVVVVTSRVLSPQYLVWLLPLVAFELGISPLWVGICVLTFLVYPALFELAGLSDSDQATSYPAPFLLAVAARNLLLLAAVWQALRPPDSVRAVAAA